MDELSVYLKKLRNEKEISLREASREIGISHTYLDSLEKGFDPRTNKKRKPTPDILNKLAKYYNVPYIKLLRLAGYFEEKGMTSEDWGILNEALVLEDDDEISINKIESNIANGKVFTLNPDERLSPDDSKRIASLIKLAAFLLYRGLEPWGTDPLLKEVDKIIDRAAKKELKKNEE